MHNSFFFLNFSYLNFLGDLIYGEESLKTMQKLAGSSADFTKVSAADSQGPKEDVSNVDDKQIFQFEDYRPKLSSTEARSELKDAGFTLDEANDTIHALADYILPPAPEATLTADWNPATTEVDATAERSEKMSAKRKKRNASYHKNSSNPVGSSILVNLIS